MDPVTRVGRYEIVRRLGKSLTNVYLAIDTLGNRPAAVKLIKRGSDSATRLILEAERRGAQIQQQLHGLDPRVVEVYDIGDEDEYFYIAMQYVEGRTLAEILRGDGRVDPRRAAAIAREVCAQLAKFHAYQAGVVHGDIKPSNIHLGLRGTVRLLDFGIAKALRPDRDSTAHSFGSPTYCAPERLGRSRVDVQSDLWSVGVTLYEMVAGTPPYQAEDTGKLEKLIQSCRPPRALPSSCPAALKAVISKSLAANPARRYLTAADLRDDLDAFLEERETAAERESLAAWSVNPTVEAQGPPPPLPPRSPRAAPAPGVRTAAVMAGCFLAGMLVVIASTYASIYWRASSELLSRLDYTRRSAAELDYDWRVYQDLLVRYAFLGGLSPVHRMDARLAASYRVAGDQILHAYRSSNESALTAADWAKAKVCFERARALGDAEPSVVAGAALAGGYSALLDIAAGNRLSRADVTRLRAEAAQDFQAAATLAPQSPDGHLALARLYVYSLPDVERALAEFRAAERLGYVLKSREIAQEADAYRVRALQRGRRADAAMAYSLYQRIPEYPGAADRARQLARLLAPPRPRRAAHKRTHRWH